MRSSQDWQSVSLSSSAIFEDMSLVECGDAQPNNIVAEEKMNTGFVSRNSQLNSLMDWAGRQPPRPLPAVPNVTAHPLTPSVPITVSLYNGPLLCCFKGVLQSKQEVKVI